MKKKLQLFMLPFAGGNSNSFHRLTEALDPAIQAITVEYSGRFTRRKEAYISEYDEFLKDVALQIRQERDSNVDFAVFGYSLGSILTYDLLSGNLIEGTPRHAFVCAKGSLTNQARRPDNEEYPEKNFVEEIAALGGTDARILQNERFLNIYMEPVKADYKVWRNFRFVPGKIPCDVTAIYSSKDPSAQGVHEWSDLSDGTVDYFEMGTNHFFINQCWKTVADIVNDHLRVYLQEK